MLSKGTILSGIVMLGSFGVNVLKDKLNNDKLDELVSEKVSEKLLEISETVPTEGDEA